MGKSTPILERFVAKVQFTDTCWIWTAAHGGRPGKHYGAFFAGKQISAHRWAYEFWVGAIPDGLEIDHDCRVTLCVNPDHLFAVTGRENVLRGNTFARRQTLQTHCKRGHAFTPENTYIAGNSGRTRYGRKCRQCTNLRMRVKYHRDKAS